MNKVSQKPVEIAITSIHWYQRNISPMRPPCCRFTPSCSDYGIEAFQVHGFVKGLGLTTWRLLRCNPFGGSGYDPVPDK